MGTRTLAPVAWTFTREEEPSTEFQASARDRLRVQSGTNVRAYAYLKYVVDLGDSETLVSLVHAVRALDVEPSTQIDAQLAENGNLTRVNWDNAGDRVPVIGSAVSDTDTQSWTHELVDEAPTGGLIVVRLSIPSGSSLVWLYGPRARRHGPTLTVVTETVATQPTNVEPSGVVSVAAPFFTWEGQPGVDTVQGSAAAEDAAWDATAGFTSPTWTSAETASTTHELDSSPAGWTGLTAGATADVSFRYHLSSGWSEWSEPVTVERIAKPVVTITNPLPTDADVTPPFVHTVTGGTQTAWRKIVFRNGLQVADSGKRAGTELSWTPTVGARNDGDAMEYEVRVYDDQDRANTPGDPAYAAAVQAWTYERSASVAPVDSLTAWQVDGTPKVALTASRSPLSDETAWLLDDERLDTTEETEFSTWLVPPNTDVVLGALAVVNGEDSAVVRTTSLRTRVAGLWLIDPETDRGFVLATGRDGGAQITLGGNTEVHNALYAAHLIRNTLSLRGLEGSVSGLIGDWSGRTWADQKADAEWLREHPERLLRLIVGDLNVEVVASDMVPLFNQALSFADRHIRHDVSFNFSAA